MSHQDCRATDAQRRSTDSAANSGTDGRKYNSCHELPRNLIDARRSVARAKRFGKSADCYHPTTPCLCEPGFADRMSRIGVDHSCAWVPDTAGVQNSSVLCWSALQHPEDQDVSGPCVQNRKSLAVPQQSIQHRFVGRGLSPGRRIRTSFFRFRSEHLTPDTTHQAKAVGANAFAACLMLVWRAQPSSGDLRDRLASLANAGVIHHCDFPPALDRTLPRHRPACAGTLESSEGWQTCLGTLKQSCCSQR